MKPKYRNSLQERLEAHAPAFRMSDATFKSFQLQDGLKRCVNAVDVVHAVTALLECGSKKAPSANFGEHVEKFWCGPRQQGPAAVVATVRQTPLPGPRHACKQELTCASPAAGARTTR
jgi:hypothetical protein